MQRFYQLTLNIVLAIFWSLFAWVNLRFFLSGGNLTQLLAVLESLVVVVLFLIRKDAVMASRDLSTNAVAFSSVFFQLLLRPSQPSYVLAGIVCMTIGLCIKLAADVSLGRSFGIIPAIRTIKSGGAYRWVRHPMYAGGVVAYVGYFLANTSWWNAGVIVVGFTLLLIRISLEEKVLLTREEYQQYTQTTRYRLLPFIY